MADIGNLNFGVHLVDYTDAEADKIKKKLENISVSLTIDGKNVSVSNPDSIKKQIEDAIKSVTVQSVKVDTASLANQIQNATSNITSQVKVSFLSGTLATDIQTYLDAKSFKVSISITKSQVQNEVNTAFANVSVPVTVKVSANAVIQQLQQSIANRSISVGLQPKNVQNFVNDIESKLKNKKIKVELEADKNFLVQSVKQALQGTAIKAQVDVNVDPSAITRAVQSAINNASFTYNPNGGRRNNANATANAQRNLGNSYRYAGNEASQSARASVTLGRAMATNIKIAGDLGTALGNLAAVFKVKDILEGVVTIGGQLENQRIALGAILQDGGKAVEMFSKIQSLAVKSPFGIMDLNQYTKQLAAYGIEYNELYDTMKRMADISAGVGVDMGRIILAFGQVRAAGFLKGTELRQFTEANIPMVEKLADRFTKLSGEIVTAGEVYDMISEKKISFEDVKAVLWDLTDEGGRFFNMQEVLAESLASKWKNLGDAIDVMLGKIAEGGTGDILKGLAEILTDLTKHWDKFALALGTTFSVMATRKVAITMLMYSLNSTKGALRAFKVELLDLKKTTKTQLAATSNEFKKFFIIIKAHLKSAKISFKAFYANISSMAKALGRTLRSVAVSFLPLAILTGIVETFYYFWNKSEESADRVKDLASAANDGFDNLSEKIKSLGDEAPKTAAAIASSIKKIETAIRDNVPNAGQILNEINKKDKNGKYENSEEERYKKLKKVLEDTQEAYKILGQEMSNVSETANKATDGFFDESFRDNLIDVSNAMIEYRSQLSMVSAQSNLYEHAVNKAAEADADFAKAINGKNLKESLSLLKDHETALRVFEKEAGSAAFSTSASFVSSIRSLRSHIKTAEKDSDEFVKYYKSQLEALGVDLNNIDQPHKIAISIDITKFLNSIEGLDDETKKLFTERILEKEFNIKLSEKEKKEVETRATPYDESKDEVAKLWKKRAEEIDKAVKMYDQWKKLEGTDKSRARVQAKDELANLFSGAYGFKLDLENPTAAYEYIQSKLNKNLSAQKELMVQLGVKISDAEFKDAQDKLKANIELLKREAEKTIQGWDLYKKLFEATGDKNVSMNIAFGKNIGFKDKLTHLRSQIETEMGKIGATIPFEKLIGMDTKDLESKGLGGLSDLIEKYNSENAKLKEESVKNFIDIIEASKDFAAQIEDIERNLEKDLKDLRANSNGADTSRAEAQLRKNAAEAISKVNFSKFKQSSDWIRVFDNLNRVSDATLDNMITKIEEFAKQGRMSEEVTKQIVDAMAKLREETIDRNPFKGFADAWERLKNYKTLKLRVGEYDEHGKLITQKDVDDGVAEANDDLEKAALAIAGKFNAVADAANMLSGVFNGFGDDLESFGRILNGIGSGAKSGAGIASALGIAGPWGAIAGAALGLLSSAFEMHDKAIQKEIEASEARIKMIDSLADNLEKRLSSAEGGIYSISIDPATKKVFEDFIEGFNGWKKYQDSSPRSAMYIKYKEYDYLSKDTIDAMQAAISNDSYYSAQLASLKLQKDELNKQKNDLERAKDIDETKIHDKVTEIEQVEHEIAVFRKTMMDAIYGIDFKDWASQFTDSIVDAWAKGEDAADAYQRTVSNVMRNVAASVIQQSLIGKWLEDNMENVLALFERNGGVITDDVFNAMAELASGIGGKVEEVEQFMDYWEKALNKYNLSMKDLESTEKASSGLSKGIQSVTEDTANLLASYVNSMRADLSVNRTLLEQLVGSDVPKMNYLAEAQLQQLQMVVANTKRNADTADKIYSLIDRVVDKGGNRLKI